MRFASWIIIIQGKWKNIDAQKNPLTNAFLTHFPKSSNFTKSICICYVIQQNIASRFHPSFRVHGFPLAFMQHLHQFLLHVNAQHNILTLKSRTRNPNIVNKSALVHCFRNGITGNFHKNIFQLANTVSSKFFWVVGWVNNQNTLWKAWIKRKIIGRSYQWQYANIPADTSGDRVTK